MPNPQFVIAIDAARSGYTWSDILRAYVKFLPRSREGGGGYDVEVTTAPRCHPLFQSQHHAIPFDTAALDRVVMACDLGKLLAGTDARWVLSADGTHVADGAFERRMVGL